MKTVSSLWSRIEFLSQFIIYLFIYLFIYSFVHSFISLKDGPLSSDFPSPKTNFLRMSLNLVSLNC